MKDVVFKSLAEIVLCTVCVFIFTILTMILRIHVGRLMGFAVGLALLSLIPVRTFNRLRGFVSTNPTELLVLSFAKALGLFLAISITAIFVLFMAVVEGTIVGSDLGWE
jgi:hypothetical protein